MSEAQLKRGCERAVREMWGDLVQHGAKNVSLPPDAPEALQKAWTPYFTLKEANAEFAYGIGVALIELDLIEDGMGTLDAIRDLSKCLETHTGDYCESERVNAVNKIKSLKCVI